MAEPEELLIEAAHLATRVTREAWRRHGPSRRRAEMPLADERPRLELFLAALFGRPIPIAAAEPPAPTTWLARFATHGRPTHARGERLPCGTDGTRVFLPPSLPIANRDEDDTRELYRLLAVQQGVRLVRGFAQAIAGVPSAEARDRLAVSEAAAVDRWIASELPGLVPRLRRVRADALASRPRAPESALEEIIRGMLASDPGSQEAIALVDDRRTGAVAGAYRPVRPVWYWGQALTPAPRSQGADVPSGFEEPPPKGPPRVSEMRRRPRVREASPDEDDRGAGTWVIRADEPQESVEDPYGLQRPADRDDHADPDGLGDSLADLPEARVVRTPGQAREVLRSGEEIARTPARPAAPPRPVGIVYPEWDYRSGEYRRTGAVVREVTAVLGDPAWASHARARHARLVRAVRSRFERMQPRRARLDRQLDGSEVDIDSFVAAVADLRAGITVDGRLYVEDRPARRELAVALLVDVSASTDAWVSSNRRIVDVEKDALVIVCEALDALGDRYAIFAFSGQGAQDVSVIPLKRFPERSSRPVQQRIAALDADRYTRMGTAIRHVVAPLCREQADRRLLLVLSDGKPNDEDVYEGRYGVEDTRQAVAEVRRQGVTVFCLTVDRAAPQYAARVFGRSGFAVLRRPEELPVVVADVLRQLIRA